jgi:hypothetical protein
MKHTATTTKTTKIRLLCRRDICSAEITGEVFFVVFAGRLGLLFVGFAGIYANDSTLLQATKGITVCGVLQY